MKLVAHDRLKICWEVTVPCGFESRLSYKERVGLDGLNQHTANVPISNAIQQFESVTLYREGGVHGDKRS